MSQLDPEKQILEHFHRGQAERGLGLMMQTYQERLYHYLKAMLKSQQGAEEVLQNTFVKAYRGFKNFRAEAKLSTWLFKIAINEANTFLRKQQLHQQRYTSLAQPLADDSVQASSLPSAETIEAYLQKAIASLPEKQREVFLLRYYEEMPYRDMAELLQTSEGALKASYHHAVKKIETYIQNVNSYEGT